MRSWAVGVVVLALAGCEVTETVVAPGERVVVLHAILSGMSARLQAEYSRTGESDVDRRISGATGSLTNLGPGPCAGAVAPIVGVAFDYGDAVPGQYYAAFLCQTEPGDRIALRFETALGEVVEGSTTVMRIAEAVMTPEDPREVAGREMWYLGYQSDTLHVVVEAPYARALQLEVQGPDDIGHTPYSLLLDTMVLRLPVRYADPLRDGRRVFLPGRQYEVAVAVLDTNAWDAARSFNDPLTGNGFINHLRGGIGVFGAADRRVWNVRVIDLQEDRREGRYRLQGLVGFGPPTIVDDTIDAVMDVYLSAPDEPQFSAFVDGRWRGADRAQALDGTVNPEGRFSGWLRGGTYYQLDGVLPGADSATTIVVHQGDPDRPLGTLRMTRAP